MKMTVKIEGMMCEHCVRAVKNALEEIEGVSAKVSLESGTAILSSAGDIDVEQVKSAVEEEGYTVVGIE